MHLLRVHRSFPKLKKCVARQSSQAAALNQDEYTETPEYPPIVDTSLKARKFRERGAVHEKIRRLNTVEEKQIGLNMPRFYGFRGVMFQDDKVPYNALPLVQCFTRTHFKLSDKLPDPYLETAAAADLTVKDIKSHVEDAIVVENEGVE